MRLKIRILPTQVTVIHGLSNRAIFNDTERSQPQISRSGHSLTLDISDMAKDTVEFYLYPTVGTVLIHSVKPELTE